LTAGSHDTNNDEIQISPYKKIFDKKAVLMENILHILLIKGF